MVLERCREKNLKLNPEKCRFRVPELSYVGHVLSSDRLKPNPRKIEVIKKMPRPTNCEELKRFLGMVTYVAKFIPNMAQITAPLRQLLEKNVEWFWDHEQEKAFIALKAAIVDPPVLKFFDQKETVCLSVHASSKGMGAVLLQNDRPVAYASKALTSCQQSYSQIEKEMLAIIYGCEHFHQYLYGQREVIVESDHKPLEAILRKSIHQAPLRLKRMILRLKPYATKVKYTPGSQLLIADALSRSQMSAPMNDPAYEFEVNVLESRQISETVFEKLVEETKKDAEHQQLHTVVIDGWPQTRLETPIEVRPYWSYREDINCYDGLMFKGDRVIVPHVFRPEILDRIHAAHLGIEKCKVRARGSVFWPGMSTAIHELVSQLCRTCLHV